MTCPRSPPIHRKANIYVDPRNFSKLPPGIRVGIRKDGIITISGITLVENNGHVVTIKRSSGHHSVLIPKDQLEWDDELSKSLRSKSQRSKL